MKKSILLSLTVVITGLVLFIPVITKAERYYNITENRFGLYLEITDIFPERPEDLWRFPIRVFLRGVYNEEAFKIVKFRVRQENDQKIVWGEYTSDASKAEFKWWGNNNNNEIVPYMYTYRVEVDVVMINNEVVKFSQLIRFRLDITPKVIQATPVYPEGPREGKKNYITEEYIRLQTIAGFDYLGELVGTTADRYIFRVKYNGNNNEIWSPQEKPLVINVPVEDVSKIGKYEYKREVKE